MSRNAFVPMEWLTAPIGGEALRTLIAISFFADAQTGECWPTNAKLQAVLGKTERNIQKDIKQIVQAGLISIREGQGKNRRFRIESPEWFDRPRRKTRHESDANPVEKRHPSTPSKSDGVQKSTPSKNDTLTPSKSDGVTPSQNDGVLIRTHPINTPIEHREREELSGQSEPGRFAEDCSSALSDLSRKPQPIPAELKRMATAVNAESWIGQVQFQEIDLADWRVAETLRILQARGGNKGPNYAWTVFRGLPEQRPVQVNGHANGTPRVKKPAELIGAEAGLAMARRALAKGETDQAEVDRYEAKVENLKRKAGIQ